MLVRYGKNELNLTLAKELIRGCLVGDAAIEANAKASFKAFHSPRIDYYCLHRSAALTIKLYVVTGNDAEEVVNPHSHAYAFNTHVLAGQMRNVLYHPMRHADGHGDWHEMSYSSPLNGERTTIDTGKVTMTKVQAPRLNPGDGYYLTTDAVHSIYVPVDSVLLLHQYADAVNPTRLYTRDGQMPDTSGCYMPMGTAAFMEGVRRVLDRIG